MIVRQNNSANDWTFGSGINNYLSANNAIAQNIQTRLQSWLGDCFFDINAGIDWLNYCSGSKNPLLLNLDLQAVILATPGVTGILQLTYNLDSQTRQFSASFQVQTTYSSAGGSFVYAVGGS